MDTPDELFHNIVQLSTNLPEDATVWPIKLYSAYFNALTSELTTHMTTNSSFYMPVLTTLTTKVTQLNAPHLVRMQESTSFETISKRHD